LINNNDNVLLDAMFDTVFRNEIMSDESKKKIYLALRNTSVNFFLRTQDTGQGRKRKIILKGIIKGGVQSG